MPATKKKIQVNSRVIKRHNLLQDAYTIKLKPQNAADGFFVLASNGQTTRLPNNTYIVGKEHLKLLKKARIPYDKVAED